MKKILDAIKNRILIAVPLLLAVVFSIYGFFAAQEDSIALEQLPRCGMVEHIHSEECYLEDFIVCGEKNHVHGENCYLLRLSDK